MQTYRYSQAQNAKEIVPKNEHDNYLLKGEEEMTRDKNYFTNFMSYSC